MPTELVGVLANNHSGEHSGNKKILKTYNFTSRNLILGRH